MTQEAIKQKINALKAETATFYQESFKEKLYCAYRAELQEHLEGCKWAALSNKRDKCDYQCYIVNTIFL